MEIEKRIERIREAALATKGRIRSTEDLLSTFCFLPVVGDSSSLCWDPKQKALFVGERNLMSADFETRQLLGSRQYLDAFVEFCLKKMETELGVTDA
jgi:hypothetical protein